ncbi:MAG: ABC transporter substrate-binding protein [Microbacteriaceae bacterium]|jgi:osmoprotectant transport system substrate-binding protein|nr:ABC transporter substrate-binding protein [Microbacteriaceae bacterium]MBT5248438.1 ABC transporter substrate-binding protein [Microbacteriaceae bacterium]MBT5616914.1 ABC transporter substrate-binding protein [Microbacteriaceae bacterium]
MRTKLMTGLALAAGLVLSGCATSEDASQTEAVVVGSQAYYSNEIIAEIYAQALEGAGYEVERKFQIGQRDAYLPELESGAVDLFPEYTGNLLQFYSPDASATEADEVYAALGEALPEGLSALAMSPATDQDSYNVTAEFAEANSLVSLEDLVGVEGLILGGAPELEERPYGPAGLLETYGVSVEFDATGDVTVDALLEGVVTMANVYSGDPRIAEFGLVTLADPQGLFLASNVVPIVSSDRASELALVIDPISKALTPEGLVALNLQSTKDEMSAADIAAGWLEANGF